MTAPIRQICIPSDGIGFVIDYRQTHDTFRRRPGGIYGSQPVPPWGDGWAIVRTDGEVTLWRRFAIWMGKHDI